MPGTYKVVLRFDNVVTGSGRMRYDFTRTFNSPGSFMPDFIITAPSGLVLHAGKKDEQKEEGIRVTCGEWSFQFADIFNPKLLKIEQVNYPPYSSGDYTYYLGLAPALGNDSAKMLSKDYDFSLFSLLRFTNTAEDFVKTRDLYGANGLPKIVLDVYLKSESFVEDFSPKYRTIFKGYVSIPGSHYETSFLWDKSKRGQKLLAGRFRQYIAAEKVIEVVALDKAKTDLDSWKPPVNTSGAAFGDGSGFSNLLPLWDSFDHDEGSITVHESVIWACDSLSERITQQYNMSFGTNYNAEVEVSNWQFLCAGIPTAAFKGSITLPPNTWMPWLTKREQLLHPTGHHVVDSFAPVYSPTAAGTVSYYKSVLGKDKTFSFGAAPNDIGGNRLWLERGFLHSGSDSNNSKPYCFSHYANAWDAITRVLSSLGYITRYSTDAFGRTRIQHAMRTRRPPLLSIPAFLTGTANPSETNYDAVQVTPENDFGEAAYLGTPPLNGGFQLGPEFWGMGSAKTCKLFEAAFDQTQVIIVWDNGFGYYNASISHVDHNEALPDPYKTTLPRASNNPFEVKNCFGLFGNKPYAIIGNSLAFKLTPEIIFVPIASGVDIKFASMDTNVIGRDSYPGLILLAGGSTDGGKTIDSTNISNQYYRGCGTIKVPYGVQNADGTFNTVVESGSMMEIFGIFLSQFFVGNTETHTLTLPTCTNFENERGETGPWAVYPMLGVEMYGRTFDITHTVIDFEEDKVSLDLQQIPSLPDLPAVLSMDTEDAPCSGTWDVNGKVHYVFGDGSDHVLGDCTEYGSGTPR